MKYTFIKKLGFFAWVIALVLNGFALTACGGGNDDAPGDSPAPEPEKGNVFTYEVYLDGDVDKFGVDGNVFAYDKGNGKGEFSSTGDVKLNSFGNEGFAGVDGIDGYCTSFGNVYSTSGKENPTTSRHFTISTAKGCEKAEISFAIGSNYYLSYQYPEIKDENSQITIRIIGYVDGVKKKEGTAVFKYSHNGGISMGLPENSEHEGYSYIDLVTQEIRDAAW